MSAGVPFTGVVATISDPRSLCRADRLHDHHRLISIVGPLTRAIGLTHH